MTSAESRPDYEMRSLEVSDEVAGYMDWVMAELAPSIRGRVLEVGAGIGTMSRRFLPVVDSLVLVEPARNLYNELAHRFAHEPRVETVCGELDALVAAGAADGQLAEGSFDTIVMVNVLEHIENDGAMLRTLPRMLAASGNLVLFVPSVPAIYGALDRRVGHHRRYTKRSMRQVVEEAGFTITRLEYFDMLGMVPWFVVGRLLGRSEVGSEAGWYDRRVVPICKAVDRVGPPVGKNLICVARRR